MRSKAAMILAALAFLALTSASAMAFAFAAYIHVYGLAV